MPPRPYDFEDLLGACEERFEELSALAATHARMETPDLDEPDVQIELLSVPLFLPGGYIWEVELYDNGDDAGAGYYIHVPSIAGRLEVGVYDAHSRFPFLLRWDEAQLLATASAGLAENRASGAARVALLLLWTAVGIAEADPLETVRARLEAAWRTSGLVSDDAARTLGAAVRAADPERVRSEDVEEAVLACLRAAAAAAPS